MLALRVVHAPERRGRWVAFALVTVIAPFVSAPSVFIAAASIAALAITPHVRASARARAVVACAVLAGTSAAVNFAMFQQTVIQSSYLQHYWQGAFFRPPWSRMAIIIRHRAGWTVQELFLGNSVAYPAIVRVVADVLVVWGVAALTRRKGYWAGILIGGPWLSVVLASSLLVYPLADRTLLFGASLMIVAVMAAIDDVVTRLVSLDIRAIAVACATALVAAPGIADAVYTGRTTLQPDNLRITRDDLLARMRHGTPVYIFSRDVPVWTWYTTDWARPDTQRVRQLVSVASSTGPNSGNAPSRRYPVHSEGADLDVVTSRREMIGIPTGIEALAVGGARLMPDPGWATNEAERIRSAADPEIWLFFTHCHGDCDKLLVDTLLSVGGTILYERSNPAAHIYLFRHN